VIGGAYLLDKYFVEFSLQRPRGIEKDRRTDDEPGEHATLALPRRPKAESGSK
jgi:hypothetical protein